LVIPASRNPGDQLIDGLTLISAGLKWGFELKRRHGTTFRPLSYHRKQHCAQQARPESRREGEVFRTSAFPASTIKPSRVDFPD
jgi:hypothetical protein